MDVIKGTLPNPVYKKLPENVYHRGSIHLDNENKIPVSCGEIWNNPEEFGHTVWRNPDFPTQIRCNVESWSIGRVL